MAILPYPVDVQPSIPPLEAGDQLDQPTFHARYKAMPAAFRAELIGGLVVVPSPRSTAHGFYHAMVMSWLVQYTIATPGTRAGDNMTTILGRTSEPQPDGALIIESSRGGQTCISEDGYLTGAPELIVEVASSSASIDLHAKRRDYEQAGVLEYVVVVLRQPVVRWWMWQAGTYQEMTADTDSIFRSRVLPGLWLPAQALLQLDGATVMEVLRQGVVTPEHAAFVARLQGH